MNMEWLIGTDEAPWYEFWKPQSGVLGGFIMAAAVFDVWAILVWLILGVLP
jgi:hypothetical protein